jgi:hypothetical protein
MLCAKFHQKSSNSDKFQRFHTLYIVAAKYPVPAKHRRFKQPATNSWQTLQ